MAETPKHKHIKDKNITIRVILLMISDSLSSANAEQRAKLDRSSKIAEAIIKEHGLEVLDVKYVPDEIKIIQENVTQCVEQQIELIITMGGTGISKRDVTPEAVRSLLQKELPGFGELFRALTYNEIGTVSIMSRALAGIKDESVIICLPGSPNAVKLGVKLILKEILHLCNLLKS